MAEKIQYRGRDLRVVFMGTPEFAVSSLRAMAEAAEVALVFTRPDAVRGRGKTLEASPVKAAALELGLGVYEAKRIDDEAFAALEAAEPDLIVVAAYGVILAKRVLDLPQLGIVNVHASLLPRWRGAAPVQRAILEGDELAGVSIMEIGEGVDTGRYCLQASTPIAEKNSEELLAELGELGARTLVEAVAQVADGSVVWTEQDEALVTHAAKISKDEMKLAPELAAAAFARKVQASSDAAPARIELGGKGVRVLAARAVSADAVAAGAPEAGAYVRQKNRVFIGVADGVVELLRVKPDGKREMDASAWAAGIQAETGSWGALA